MAAAAGLSRAHFSVEFRRAFGVSPHVYLLTRRLERAAALLRTTDSVGGRRVRVGRSQQRRLVHRVLPPHVRPDAHRVSRRLPAGRRPRPRAGLRAAGLWHPPTSNVSRRRPSALAASIGVHPNQPQTGGHGSIRIATTQLWVHDQDAALRFYTEQVGMEVRQDVTMPEMGNFRWLTVAPAGSGRGHRADGHPARARSWTRRPPSRSAA